jgi:hypothetical protein
MLLPAFAWPVVAWAAASRWEWTSAHAAAVAAAAVGACTLHHAFSRADLYHLAPAVPPVILGVVALAGSGAAWPVVAAVLAAATAVTVLSVHPRWERFRRPELYVRRDVAGSPLWIWRGSDTLVGALRPVVGERLLPEEPLFAVPTLAELFPILDRRSAVYDTFCVYPAAEREQQRMLAALEREGVRLAVVRNDPLDGRDDLRFSRTHPLVWSHLQEAFEPLDVPGLPPGVHVLCREAAATPTPRPRAAAAPATPASAARNAPARRAPS